MIENLRHIDKALFHIINHDLANPVLDVLCPWFREKLMWIPLYLLIAFLLFRKYGNRILWLGLLTVVTILISDQTSNIFKHLVHRLRPCNNPELADTIHHVVDCGVGFSFVSAHAANHFAIATFISFLMGGNKKWQVFLYLWASVIAFSQVYVGVHYPIDVLAGAIVGIVAGFITGNIAKRFVISNT